MLLKTTALAMGIALSVSSAARADPVNIVTSGFYSVVWDEESDFRFLGTGFEVIGLPNSGSRPLFRCHPCEVGTSLDLSDNFDSVQNVHTPAIFDGRSHSAVFYTGSMVFRAGSVLAPFLPDSGPAAGVQATLRAPFVASGFLTAYDNEAHAGLPVFSGAFSGRGTASAVFVNQGAGSGFDGVWTERVTYDFQDASQTPEPATLLLMSTGVITACAARRRKDASTTRLLRRSVGKTSQTGTDLTLGTLSALGPVKVSRSINLDDGPAIH
jgi:hypothetical protein